MPDRQSPPVDAKLLARQSLPGIPALEPCTLDAVGVDHALQLSPDLVCKICRWSLVAVTTYSDPLPLYLHSAPVPPSAMDDGAQQVLEDALLLALHGLGVPQGVISSAFIRAHNALRDLRGSRA